MAEFLILLAASLKDFSFCRSSCIIKPHSLLIDKHQAIKLADMSDMSGSFSVLEPLTLMLFFTEQLSIPSAEVIVHLC